jgi:hypothetical protein
MAPKLIHNTTILKQYMILAYLKCLAYMDSQNVADSVMLGQNGEFAELFEAL